MVSWMDVNVRKTKAPDDFRISITLWKLGFSTNTKAQNLFTRKNLFAIHGTEGDLSCQMFAYAALTGKYRFFKKYDFGNFQALGNRSI